PRGYSRAQTVEPSEPRGGAAATGLTLMGLSEPIWGVLMKSNPAIRLAVGAAAAFALTLSPALAGAAPDRPGEPRYSEGAEGAGDPYFPLAGNGGIDVLHYDLDLTY